jgi:hydrogenase assembly chaperone HypC/HupF
VGTVGRVVEVCGDDAVIDVLGVRTSVDAPFIKIAVGDWVMVHTGLVIGILKNDQVKEILDARAHVRRLGDPV